LIYSALKQVPATLPYSLLDRMLKPSLLVGYYHVISNDEIPHIKHLYRHKAVPSFVADLEFLTRHYIPIGLDALIRAIHGGQQLPPRAFHLTFDDGFSEMASIVAPLLSARGIPATFFVSSGFIDNRALCYQHKASLLIEHIRRCPVSSAVKQRLSAVLRRASDAAAQSLDFAAIPYAEKGLLDEAARILEYDFEGYLRQRQPYLTHEQLIGLIRNGFTIGAHSIDHPRYSTLPLAEQLRQTHESLSYVRTRFDLPYAAFAFPHADDGVSTEFFSTLQNTGSLDISFGTGGLLNDTCKRNIQRVNFEKPLWTARRTMKYHLARGLMKRALGQGTLRRL
jgi:peptidoglycan/xylan/chitin deacetylase (PgdA/CDA1 family)